MLSYYVIHSWLNLRMQTCGYRGPAHGVADYKLYMDFSSARGLAPLKHPTRCVRCSAVVSIRRTPSVPLLLRLGLCIPYPAARDTTNHLCYIISCVHLFTTLSPELRQARCLAHSRAATGTLLDWLPQSLLSVSFRGQHSSGLSACPHSCSQTAARCLLPLHTIPCPWQPTGPKAQVHCTAH